MQSLFADFEKGRLTAGGKTVDLASATFLLAQAGRGKVANEIAGNAG